jgi:hypothetical protein
MKFFPEPIQIKTISIRYCSQYPNIHQKSSNERKLMLIWDSNPRHLRLPSIESFLFKNIYALLCELSNTGSVFCKLTLFNGTYRVVGMVFRANFAKSIHGSLVQRNVTKLAYNHLIIKLSACQRPHKTSFTQSSKSRHYQ